MTTITDQNRAVVQRYSYDSFGRQTPTTSFRNSYTFTGREWDSQTGLYYYRARYYDPGEGRFISKDPIGFAAGINVFAYVQNNPIYFIDPLGLDLCEGIARAKKYLSDANGDPDKAWNRAYDDRNDPSRNWEALTHEGQVLRDAENYLWAMKVVSEGENHWYGQGGSYLANSLISIPGWQAWTALQNMTREKLHSPASLEALSAGFQGAWAGLGYKK